MNWVTFVGEGRSGHTVLSGALGSHPNAKIAEEQKYISKWRRGWSADDLLFDALQAGPGKAREEQGWPGLRSFKKPLTLVGDKCGWDAVNEYTKRSAPVSLITDFETFIDKPVKVIVTLRNPLDNISSWVQGRKYQRKYPDEDYRVYVSVKRHRRFYKAAWEVIQGTDYFLVHHEELIKHPNELLQELSDWLGLPAHRDWRRFAGSRIWTNPRIRRDDVYWSEKHLATVSDFVQSHPLMEYYR